MRHFSGRGVKGKNDLPAMVELVTGLHKVFRVHKVRGALYIVHNWLLMDQFYGIVLAIVPESAFMDLALYQSGDSVSH